MKNVSLCRSAYNRLIAALCCIVLLPFGTATAQLPETKVEDQATGNYHRARAEFYKQWDKIQQRRREINEISKKEAALGGQTSSTLEKLQGGFKTFKRWEWYWGTRVAADGSFPSRDEYEKEWQKYLQQRKNSMIAREMAGRMEKKQESALNIWAGWSHLGPWGAPSLVGGGSAGTGIGRIHCLAFGGSEDTIYAGSFASGLWRTTNRGQNWYPMTTELPPHGVTCIAVDPRLNGRMYIGTSRMRISGMFNGASKEGLGMYRSNDKGQTWTALTVPSDTTNELDVRRLRIHPTGPDTIFAATNQGIFRSNNGGTTWFMVSGGNVADLEFHPTDPSIIYATSYRGGGNGARIWRSTSGGSLNSFSTITTNIPSTFGRIEIAVSADEPDWIYAMCSDTLLVGFRAMYRTTNTGDTWTAIVSPGSLSTLTGSQAWLNFALAVSPSDANVVCSGGLDFWRSDNGGGTNTWQKKTNWNGSGSDYLHADQWDIAYPPGSTGAVVYISNDGGVYRSANWGTTWTPIHGNMSTMTLYRLGVDQSHSDMTVVGAQDNGTSRYWPYINGSWHPTWERIQGGDGMESLVSPTQKVYTMIQNGRLFISGNWGNSYSENTPSGQVDGQGDGRGYWVTPVMYNSATVGCIITGYDRLYAIKDQEPNIPAVGHRQASVPFPNTGEIAIAMQAKGSTIYAATIDGNNDFRLYRGAITIQSYTPPMSAAVYTFPYVSSWTQLSGGPSDDPVTSIEIHPDDENVVYVANGRDGAVFKSVNKGRTWIDITGGLPEVAVNSIVFHEDDAKPYREGLYIGTDFGVYYRDNAMADWDVFDIGNGFGLPNSPIMEIEIHKNESLLRAATFGRGLYECELYTPSMFTKYYPVAYGRNSDSYWINKVKIWSGNGTQEQVTGDNGGYLDVTRSTTLSLELYTGGTHKLEVSRGKSASASSSLSAKYRVWIDLNRDGTFDDAGELVGSADNTAATAVTTIWMNLPDNVVLGGFTRMRIAMAVNGTPDHDSPFANGEVEDYQVYIKDCINFGGVLSAYPVAANSATILWSGSENSAYELRYRVQNTSTWTTTTQITSPNGYPDIFNCELTGLTANTYYEVQVRSKCGLPNAGVTTNWAPASPFVIRTIPSSAPYCASFSMPMQGALSDCETYISNVKLTRGLITELNHNSNNDFGYQKFGYSGWGMPLADLPAGSWFSVSLTAVELCPPDFNDLFRRWRIWVDLDHDNEFESNELLYDSNNSTSSLSQTGSMFIPLSGTTLGSTRMRVSMKGIGVQNTALNAAGPCEVLDYGEVQDYHITLYNPNARGIVTGYTGEEEQVMSLVVSPNPATDELRVEYTCLAADDAAVEIVDMFGRVVASIQQPCMQGRNNIVIPVHNLANGVYTLRITNSQKVMTQGFTIVK